MKISTKKVAVAAIASLALTTIAYAGSAIAATSSCLHPSSSARQSSYRAIPAHIPYQWLPQVETSDRRMGILLLLTYTQVKHYNL